MMHLLAHLPFMRLLFLFVTAITLAACGPDLNSPASTSLTGKWQSSDTASFFYNVKMDITQTPAGDVSGAWSSQLMGGHLSCPEGSTCSAANTVSGSNTVVGVSINLLGIGTFTGQLENGNVLRGDLDRFDGAFRVKFTKIP
jgi:hypothetical protein